jgi:diguanylate cyclase (GGDEF)-like protein
VKLFVSWSGDESRSVAEALSTFIEHVVVGVNTFVSTQDVGLGEAWDTRINEELATNNHGILCLTRDNQQAPWINYEAGALSKILGVARVTPYTIRFPPGEIVPGPLSRFQGVRNDKPGTRRLIEMLNSSLDIRKSEPFISEAFEVWWPRLEEKMASSQSSDTANRRPDPNEVLLEIRGNTRQLLHLATAGSTNIGAAIELLENAIRDPLTGLANRNALASRLSELSARSIPYVLALIDLDGFKRVNDTLGHAAGDRVLALVGDVLKRSLVGSDIIARFGGDEFVVVFADATPQRVLDAVKAVAPIVADTTEHAHLTRILFSAGISSDRIEAGDEKLRQADTATYAAKRSGGNTVVIADA